MENGIEIRRAERIKKQNFKKVLKIYAVFVAALFVLMIFAWSRLYRICKDYEIHSAAAIVNKACEEVRSITGKEAVCDMIPRGSVDGEYSYIIKCDGENTAKVTLTQTESPIFILAFFEQKDIQGLCKEAYILGSGAQLRNGEEIIDPSAFSEYRFAGTGKLPEKVKDFPKFYSVELTDLLSTNQVSIEKNGVNMPQMQIDGMLFGCESFDPQEAKTIEKRCIELVTNYSNFISTDITLNTLKGYVSKGSELADRFGKMEVRWYTGHSGTELKNIKISEPLYLADRWALIETAYDYSVRTYNKTTDIPTELTLCLHKDDDGLWRMMELTPSLILELPLKTY